MTSDTSGKADPAAAPPPGADCRMGLLDTEGASPDPARSIGIAGVACAGVLLVSLAPGSPIPFGVAAVLTWIGLVLASVVLLRYCRRLEEKFRVTRAWAHGLFQDAPEAIISIDSDGSVQAFNTAAACLFGYKTEEILGRNIDRIIPEAYRLQHVKALQKRVETGHGCLLDVGKEVEGLHRDGQHLPVEILIRHFSTGEGDFFTAYLRDLRYRRQREQQTHMLTTAIEQARESIVIATFEGIVQYANPAFAEMNGRLVVELLGQEASFLTSSEHDDAFYEEIRSTLREGNVWSGNIMDRSRNGTLHETAATLSPVSGENGEVTHFVSVMRELGEEKMLEAQLRQAQKLEAVGQLSAGIAHEINTPTQYVSDNVRFLKDSWASLNELLNHYGKLGEAVSRGSVPDGMLDKIGELSDEADLEFLSEEIPKAITESLTGLERVATIVRAMKEFAHPGADEMTMVHLNHSLQSTVTVARNEWKYVAEVIMDLDPADPEIHCFAGPLNQVFLNLLVNAAHAIAGTERPDESDKGTITIQTRLDGDQVEVRIEDDGGGIPTEIQDRIFDPFFTTKEVGKGTGQGLAIAYSVVVDKHRGTLRFESEPGEGTCFILRLPIQGPDRS